MTQDEINRELDQALEEAIFNGDITKETPPQEMKSILSCMVQITEEQFQLYALYCLEASVENSMRKKSDERVH